MKQVIETLIVREIFGWKVEGYNHYGHPFVDKYDNGGAYPFAPTNSITDAWYVVDKLKQEDQYYFILQNGDYYDYECTFRDYFTNEEFVAEADTAPLAICLAALKVNRINLKSVGESE